MDNLTIKYINHIKNLCSVDCNIFDIRLKDFTSNINYCKSCPKQCNYHNTHLYGCYEAQRWENKYIYYCPLGYIFICISILNDIDIVEQGIIAGPIIMENSDDFNNNSDVIVLDTKKVNDLTEIIKLIFTKISTKHQSDNDSKEFLNDMYKVIQDTSINSHYPIDIEKELQEAILNGNSKLSKELLNKLLGHIFFHSNGDFEVIKLRVMELIVLLSRSAIDGGADIDQIFALNNDYMKEFQSFHNIEKLSPWLTNLINRFIGYMFEFTNIKHTDTIYKTTAYIKENYMKKLTLDEIANHVYLSKSYLSKIFKEEMNLSLTNYINNIRVEKSKSLLKNSNLSIVDISNIVGFDDQSYFTKVFKKFVGISPGKYKEKYNKMLK